MQTLSTTQPLPSQDDLWGHRADQAPTGSWVSHALAWMRDEYRRSNDDWVARFETPHCNDPARAVA